MGREKGEGSIEQLPSGKFRAVVSEGSNATGGRKRVTFTADTRREVQNWLREKLGEKESGRLGHAGKATLADWFGRWLAAKKVTVEESTWLPYECHFRRHISPRDLADVRLSRLTAAHVEDLYADMARSGEPATKIRKVGTTLRACLAAAVEAGLLGHSPAARVKRPRSIKPQIRPYRAAEAVALLAASPGRWFDAYARLAIDGGLRTGEILGLHWPEVDLGRGTVAVVRSLQQVAGNYRLKAPKTEAGRRKVLLTPATVEALRAYRTARAGGGLLFTNRAGSFMSKSTLRNAYQRACLRAGVPATRPHDLRHTCATLLLESGVNVKAVSERLGHASVELTLRIYSHVLPTTQEHCRAVMGDILSGRTPRADATDG